MSFDDILDRFSVKIEFLNVKPRMTCAELLDGQHRIDVNKELVAWFVTSVEQTHSSRFDIQWDIKLKRVGAYESLDKDEVALLANTIKDTFGEEADLLSVDVSTETRQHDLAGVGLVFKNTFAEITVMCNA